MKRILIMFMIMVACMFLATRVGAAEKFYVEPIGDVVVNYNQTIGDLIEAGNYILSDEAGYISGSPCGMDADGDCSVLSPPIIQGAGEKKFRFSIVHLKAGETDVQEIWKHMENNDLEPADINQLLSFGIQYPEKMSNLIVALDSGWTMRNTDFWYYFGINGKSIQSLYTAGSPRYVPGYRFLAMDKYPKRIYADAREELHGYIHLHLYELRGTKMIKGGRLLVYRFTEELYNDKRYKQYSDFAYYVNPSTGRIVSHSRADKDCCSGCPDPLKRFEAQDLEHQIVAGLKPE